MADISVTPAGGGEFTVEVAGGGTRTTHRVTVPAGTAADLGVDPALLVEESFRFLLEREPKESILNSFDLAVIARYFPEYPDEIRRRLES
jgi:hypothetical protein